MSLLLQCAQDLAPETAIPEVDDQVDPTQIATGSIAQPYPTSTDMSASLPPGWNKNSARKDVSVMILTLALVLAIAICGLIFGCVGWRRKRRALTQKDLEKKLRKHKIIDDNLVCSSEYGQKLPLAGNLKYETLLGEGRNDHCRPLAAEIPSLACRQTPSPTIEQIAIGLHVSETPHLGWSLRAYRCRTCHQRLKRSSRTLGALLSDSC